jgi:hypothetical protein
MMEAANRDGMQALLERWQRSGESAAAFSRRHGIHPQKLSYWKRVLGFGQAKGVATSARARFVPVRVVGDSGTATTGTLEIRVGADYRVVVREGVSGALLREVLAALRDEC